MSREPGLKLIIAYKFVRAAISLVGSVAGVVLLLSGRGPLVELYATTVHDHAASALALGVTRLLMSTFAPSHLIVVTTALGLDAAMLLVEGGALLRGWKWGPWVVVGLSGALIPFEIASLARHPSWVRVLVLIVNGAIVAWLVRYALRRRAQ